MSARRVADQRQDASVNPATSRGRTAGSAAAARARGGRPPARESRGSQLMGTRRAPLLAASGPTFAADALTAAVVLRTLVGGGADGAAVGCAG
jgi:hypothetical protein